MKEVKEIASKIQSMMIAQYGYPWILEENISASTISMVYNVREQGVDYKMKAKFIIDQDEDDIRFEILTSTPLSLLFVKDMAYKYLAMEVVCDENDKDIIAKGIQTFIAKDTVLNRPYAVMEHIVKPYIEEMENALIKCRF